MSRNSSKVERETRETIDDVVGIADEFRLLAEHYQAATARHLERIEHLEVVADMSRDQLIAVAETAELAIAALERTGERKLAKALKEALARSFQPTQARHSSKQPHAESAKVRVSEQAS